MRLGLAYHGLGVIPDLSENSRYVGTLAAMNAPKYSPFPMTLVRTFGLVVLLLLPSVSSAAEGAVQHLSGAEALTRAASHPAPKYPRVAQSGNIEGPVKLRLMVSEKGIVTDVQAVSGNPILLIAARDTAKNWQFRTSSAFDTEITFVFSLRTGIAIVGSAR